MSGSWIAYLSACSTAEIRDMNLRDEALHITRGFLIAGFSHVIGSLWPAEDDVCVYMAAYFYEALVARRATATDSNRAVAEAVRDATLRIRRQYCHTPLSWALYTHVGAWVCSPRRCCFMDLYVKDRCSWIYVMISLFILERVCRGLLRITGCLHLKDTDGKTFYHNVPRFTFGMWRESRSKPIC